MYFVEIDVMEYLAMGGLSCEPTHASYPAMITEDKDKAIEYAKKKKEQFLVEPYLFDICLESFNICVYELPTGTDLLGKEAQKSLVFNSDWIYPQKARS